MTIQISEYVDVQDTARRLGCQIPLSIAVLPRNFSTANDLSELVHAGEACTVRQLLKKTGIVESRLEKDGDSFPCMVEKHFEWAGPLLFFAAAELSGNPEIISVALGIISDYLSEVFKGASKSGVIKLDVVVEMTAKKQTTKISYSGGIESFHELQEIVKEVLRRDQ